MATRRLFIIGETLFAETLTQMLSREAAVRVIGSAPSPTAALPLLSQCSTDVVVVAGSDEMSTPDFGELLATYPDLPVICADLSRDMVQVITSHRIGNRSIDLLAAVAELPERR